MFCITLSACTSSNNINPNKQKDFILSDSAIGNTKEAAKNKALANLAQQISVNVSSQFESQETLVNNNYNSKYNNNIKLSAKAYFQGVTYFNERKINKNSYEIFVGLSSKSLIESMNFLSQQLLNNSAKIEFISKFEMEQDLQKANFLLSLFSYAKIKNIPINNSNYQAIVKYQQQLEAAVKAVAQIKFLVYPNSKQVVITINGKKYHPFVNIYLAAEDYTYKVSLDGYKSEEGTLSLSRGSNFQVKVYLQKLLSKPFLTNLKVNDSQYNDIIKTLIYNNQMKINHKSQNSINFNFQNIISNKVINNYYNIVLPLTIEFYRGDSLINTFQINISYLANENNATIPLNIVQEQLEDKTKEFFTSIYN